MKNSDTITLLRNSNSSNLNLGPITEESIRLRLRNPNAISNSSSEVTNDSIITNVANIEYINGSELQAWPQAILRPSIEEVHRARIAEYSLSSVGNNNQIQASVGENYSIASNVPGSVF